MKIYLVRHCVSEANESGTLCGMTDSPLSAKGIKQAEQLCMVLRKVKFDRVVSSPLGRSLDTAKTVVGKRSAHVEIMNDLAEVNFGEWENMTFAEIEKLDSELFKRFIMEDEGFSFPGGESLFEFKSRIRKVADALSNNNTGTTMVFSHGGVIRHLLCHYLDLPYDKKYIFDIQPGSIAVLDFYDGATALSRLEVV